MVLPRLNPRLDSQGTVPHPSEPVLNSDAIYLNGVNAVTGHYLVPPTPMADLVSLIKAQTVDPQTRVLSQISEMASSKTLGLPIDRDPKDLRQAGWGIVFHAEEKQEVRDALKPLIDHRRSQVGDEKLVKVLDYKSGEGLAQWLARFGVAPGTVDPTKVPYYLLFVGSPSQIPFTFCSLLDVEYAVGHIAFDSAEEYAVYGENLVAYETKKTTIRNAREVLFFATRHSLDGATRLSADKLVLPLADGIPSQVPPVQSTPCKFGFRSRKIWGDAATKNSLIEVMRGTKGRPPAIFFSATHGVGGWSPGSPSQVLSQGALLCQDWPGPGKIAPDYYFSAEDIPEDAQVQGLIAFLFACYSVGTPQYDRYVHRRGVPPPEIAKSPFYARLPQRMLTHKNGSALACIGHIDRAWGYSIVTEGAGPQLQPFQNALGSIMEGVPLGHAVQDFNQRFAVLSTDLNTLLEDVGYGAQVPETELATRWIERNDAEGYLIFGDPAVRLRLEDLT